MLPGCDLDYGALYAQYSMAEHSIFLASWFDRISLYRPITAKTLDISAEVFGGRRFIVVIKLSISVKTLKLDNFCANSQPIHK